MKKQFCNRNGIKKEGESCTLNNNCIFPNCQQETEEPSWVCLDCANKRGARIPQGHCFTSHIGICGICQEEKEVTEPRDFGITRNLLRVISSSPKY